MNVVKGRGFALLVPFFSLRPLKRGQDTHLGGGVFTPKKPVLARALKRA